MNYSTVPDAEVSSVWRIILARKVPPGTTQTTTQWPATGPHAPRNASNLAYDVFAPSPVLPTLHREKERDPWGAYPHGEEHEHPGRERSAYYWRYIAQNDEETYRGLLDSRTHARQRARKYAEQHELNHHYSLLPRAEITDSEDAISARERLRSALASALPHAYFHIAPGISTLDASTPDNPLPRGQFHYHVFGDANLTRRVLDRLLRDDYIVTHNHKRNRRQTMRNYRREIARYLVKNAFEVKAYCQLMGLKTGWHAVLGPRGPKVQQSRTPVPAPDGKRQAELHRQLLAQQGHPVPPETISTETPAAQLEPLDKMATHGAPAETLPAPNPTASLTNGADHPRRQPGTSQQPTPNDVVPRRVTRPRCYWPGQSTRRTARPPPLSPTHPLWCILPTHCTGPPVPGVWRRSTHHERRWHADPRRY